MSKVYELDDAIRTFVHSGDHIAFGGFTTDRKPYAAVHEILRQGIGDLILEGGPAGGDADLLIGEGRLKALINVYCGNSGFTNVCRRFRKAIESGALLFEDYSLDAQPLMFHAAALGLPYLPIRYMLGSSLAEEWGISEEIRRGIDKLPDQKLLIRDNPFDPGEKLVLVPAVSPDVAVIHAQKASPDGTVRIEGSLFTDLDVAMASKHCIVTCEELVTDEELRKEPGANTIPGFAVTAVVHAPYGAHPCQCYNCYDLDEDYYREYDEASKTDQGFRAFVDRWVYGPKDHGDYIERLGANRLLDLRVTGGLGFVSSRKG